MHDEPLDTFLTREAKSSTGQIGKSLGVAIRMELLPTPNTMDTLPPRTPEKIAESKKRSPGGYRNLREVVVNELELLPTPTTRDYKDGTADHIRNGVVQTDTVARAVFSSGEISNVAWGKYEPAIRRWEAILGRTAPVPIVYDGKNGAPRLNAKLAEWMMGMPEDWICGADISRNEMLKACGNGVVQQQAELALTLLTNGLKFE